MNVLLSGARFTLHRVHPSFRGWASGASGLHTRGVLPDRVFDRMTMSDLRKHYPGTVTYGRTTAGHHV